MALTKTQVSELYVAIFNRASEGEGNQYWQGLDGSAADIAALMLATPAAQAYFGDSLDSDQAFIEHIYLNTLGKTYADDAEGIDYWVGRLEAGEDRGALIAELVVAAQHPDFAGTPAQQQFLNRVEVSDYTADTLFNAPADFATSLGFDGDLVVTENPGTINGAKDAVDAIADDQPGEPGEPGEEGQRIRLTEGRDDVTGTSGDDIFTAFAGQNQNGTIVNEFATGDFIDGGAGRDTLQASIQTDLLADSGAISVINGRTVNVEEVHLEALSVSGSEAIGGAGTVQVDAGRMDSVQEFWSDNSSANLQIEDIRLGSKLNITKDVTFGLHETDFGTDFTALFDSQSLVNAPAQQVNSALSIRIADVSTETPEAPLTNVNLNLSFNLGGETVTLENVQANGGTYLGLVAAIRTALVEAGHPELKVDVGAQYNQVTFAGNTVNLPFIASEVLITDPNGNAFTGINFTQSAIDPVQGGFLVAGNAEPVDPAAVSNLIESNLILDNAGRGSTAGDVVIGGMSNSNGGVQKFNVTVEGARQSKIASLNTTNNLLQEIEIDSAEGSTASLAIGGTQAGLREIDANGFTGANLSLGTGATGAAAIQNLLTLDAGQTTANVNFHGVNAFVGQSGLLAQILTGAGNDNIVLEQYGESISGSTQTSSVINAGGGNNTVTLITANDGIDNDATVITGAGVDVINGGANNLTAHTGAGNDVIYAENTGAKAQVSYAAGVWNAAVGDQTIKGGTVAAAELLNGREIQVTLDIPGASSVAGFVDGFEAKVTTVVSSRTGSALTDERDLYEAVANAINTDPVLNKLAVATVNSAGTLVVTYKVDGEADPAQPLVEIEVLDHRWADAATAQRTNLVNALKARLVDSTIVAADVETAYDNLIGIETIDAVGVAAQPHSFVVDSTTLTVDGTEDVTFTIGTDAITLSSFDTGTLPTTVTIGTEDYSLTLSGTDLVLTSATLGSVSPAPVLTVTDSALGSAAGVFTNGVDGIAVGSNSLAAGGTNTVNGGLGDDVIVLSSDANTNDAVVFDAGGFGNDTVVHFTSGALATGGDLLHFGAWLNNETSHSGSVESRELVSVELNLAPGAINANDVTVVDFDVLNLDTGVSFANMTNAQVLKALNDGAFTVAATTGPDLVGDVQKSLLLVQSKGDTAVGAVNNEGLYKVYEVTSSNDAGTDFTAANLVGSIDFGVEQSFVLANFDYIV